MAASVANLLPERRHYECGCEILRERVQRLVDRFRDGLERAGGAKASCAAQDVDHQHCQTFDSDKGAVAAIFAA
jgi:hypothetical protein